MNRFSGFPPGQLADPRLMVRKYRTPPVLSVTALTPNIVAPLAASLIPPHGSSHSTLQANPGWSKTQSLQSSGWPGSLANALEQSKTTIKNTVNLMKRPLRECWRYTPNRRPEEGPTPARALKRFCRARGRLQPRVRRPFVRGPELVPRGRYRPRRPGRADALP